MSSVLSRVAAAAVADPLFSELDCLNLDREIGRSHRDLKAFRWLNEDDIHRLQADLNCIASGRVLEDAVSFAKPEIRLKRLKAIEERCGDLMRVLGIDPQLPSWDIPIEHLIADGLFEETDEYEHLISSVRTLSQIAAGVSERLRTTATKKETKRVLSDYRLIDDLAHVYTDLWGQGQLQVSVNERTGGPSIRFLVSTLRRICGGKKFLTKAEITTQTALNAILTLRSNEVDLSKVPSVFTPNGGNRTLAGSK